MDYLLVFPLGCFALAIGYMAFQTWPRSPEQEYRRLYAKFREQRAGATFEGRQAELSMRTAAARLRRRVSEATLRKPGAYREHLSKIATEEARGLRDRTVANHFLNWAGNADMDEILYPAARRSVHNISMAAGRRALRAIANEDDIAALRVRN